MKFNIPLCDLALGRNSNVAMTEESYVKSKDIQKNKSFPTPVQSDEESEDESNESYEVRKIQPPKKRIVRIVDIKSQEDDENEDPDYKVESEKDSSSSEEDNKNDDSDYEEENKKMKRERNNKVPKAIITVPKVKKNLSTYEQMIEKNRLEKMAFLQSLKIDEAKIDLAQAVNCGKKKPKPVKRKFKEKTSPPVLRKSRRLANMSADLSEEALYSNAVKAAFEKEVKKTLPTEMSFKDALKEDLLLYESYVTDIAIEESKSEAKLITYDKSDLKKMTLSESNIAKITPSRITSLAWYPSSEQLIIAAGDKYGHFGIMNVNSESDPYVMTIHLEGITNLQFNPFNQVQLISSSYDGIVRCGDMVQHEFNTIYNVSEETCCTYFDILSETTFLVAQKDGQVALVDKRTRGKSYEKKHDCHDYSIKTVNIHPVNRSFFLTADNRGTMRLWDLRKLQKNPVANITRHQKCIQSAFFSPITGNSILTTSSDDTISIFDSSNLTSDIEMKQRMKHNNQTGRWLSVFRARWLPNSEEAFVIGSMDYPRKIEVYDKNMFAYHNMIHENLTTITSTNVFHPTRLALAGGNSSGKVFVFT